MPTLPHSPSLHLPIWREVDVLVVGASAGAVAAALEIRRSGRTALVVSELSYLGEESAGTLNLWPEGLDRADALVGAMYPQAGGTPALPNGVKRALETALLDAGVPFLYLARPIALLRDAAGGVAGAVLAARTALFAVRCRAVVDATRYGVLAKLAGAPLAMRTELPASVAWTVLAKDEPAGWEGPVQALCPPFRQTLKEGDATFQAYRLSVARATLGPDPHAWEHRVRARLAADLLIMADIIPDVPAEVIAGVTTLYDGPVRLPEASFSQMPGLFLLNGLLPLTLDGAGMLERSDVQVAMGRRVGAMVASSLVGTAPAHSPELIAHTGGAVAGDYRFAPAFLRQTEGWLAVSPLLFPVLGTYDVVVAGGGTGGAPAGIAAARAGASTLVLETQHGLGGIGTLGLIADYWFGNRVGFTAEVDAAVMELDPASRETGGKRWSPEAKIAVYHRLLQEAGGTAWLGSFAFGVRLQGDQVDGVLVSTPLGAGVLHAGCVVDATGNADLPAAAGAPCRVIGAAHVATQGAGLSPRVHPGVRHQNSDYTFVDETDPEGVTAAFANARAKFPADFTTAPLVDTRERRQIIGDYEISPLDILAERTFPDTVVTACSNFDTHGFIVHPLFMVAEPDHDPLQAHVPFRCLLPQGLEGVLVTGLGVSAHRDALPVIRMQADVQNQGYAAGLAAAIAAAGSRRLRDLDIRALQHRLVAVGILAPDVPAHGDSFPLSDAAVSQAAAGELGVLMNAAILFAHPVQGQPLLREILAEDADPDRRLAAASILGLMGCPEAAPALAEAVRVRPWDEGWNYRGMGQFGASMSRLDALLLALARTQAPGAAEVIAAKVRQLDATAAFSHCRVVGIAAALLGAPPLTAALADLLALPGMQGHARAEVRAVLAAANGDPTETLARNLALRELYLAGGLFLAGDRAGCGRAILAAYAGDWRGHFARHARALLAGAGTDVHPSERA